MFVGKLKVASPKLAPIDGFYLFLHQRDANSFRQIFPRILNSNGGLIKELQAQKFVGYGREQELFS